MSVRSILRPSVKNCQASSRFVDESTMQSALQNARDRKGGVVGLAGGSGDTFPLWPR